MIKNLETENGFESHNSLYNFDKKLIKNYFLL